MLIRLIVFYCLLAVAAVVLIVSGLASFIFSKPTSVILVLGGFGFLAMFFLGLRAELKDVRKNQKGDK